jgi:hypothetical protein
MKPARPLARRVPSRRLYALAGAVWGLVLGAVAGIGAVGYALGFSWLFLFGDSAWPDAAGPVIFGLGIAVSLFFLISLTAVGYVYGRRLEQETPDDSARQRRRAFVLMAAAGVLALVLVGAGAARELAHSRAREARATEEAAFTDLIARRHDIRRIDVDTTSDGDLIARVHLSGDRVGDYRLSRRVSDPTYDSTLVAGEDTYRLTDSEPLILLRFALSELRSQYHDRVIAGRGGVLVDQDFELAIELVPLLTPDEEAALPEREIHNLSLGFSPLIVEATAALPVRFTIR